MVHGTRVPTLFILVKVFYSYDGTGPPRVSGLLSIHSYSKLFKNFVDPGTRLNFFEDGGREKRWDSDSCE